MAKDGTKRGSKPGERRGGRAKGTPNRNTLALRERLEALGMGTTKPCMEELLARIAWGDAKEEVVTKSGGIVKVAPPLKLRAWCAGEVLSYLEPKRKAIEFKDKDGNTVDPPQMVDFATLPEVTPGLLRVMQAYQKAQAKRKGKG